MVVMQIIIVLLASFQVLWTYSWDLGRVSPNQVYASKFACSACSHIDFPPYLHSFVLSLNYTMSTGGTPEGSPQRGAPTPAPRAIQLTVKYPTFNWDQGDPISSSIGLNIELRFSWRALMRTIKTQTR